MIGTISTVVIAVVALIGVVAAVGNWFYRRGGQEKSFADAIQDNTSAHRELTAELRSFKDATVDRLHHHDLRIGDHESRLGVLERSQQ